MKTTFPEKIRYHINQFIFDQGFAPSPTQLAKLSHSSEEEVKVALDHLVEKHTLVLHPNSFKIWVAHPFALFPTLFWVTSDDKSWYSNCTWCSFGIAALCQPKDVQIHTKLSGEKEAATIHIVNGEVQEKDWLVHFPIPAKKFWNNVIYTCANMLTFESTNAVEEWCEQHHVNQGEIKPLPQVWELAKIWYGNYLSPNWSYKSVEYAHQLFEQVGFNTDFWRLD
ncbi:hypothetical protein BKI52_41915 [marine bacterium AO1-C]|nr:hypothetical protein BKI52_41915 [marine bacterium AO1-C]